MKIETQTHRTHQILLPPLGDDLAEGLSPRRILIHEHNGARGDVDVAGLRIDGELLERAADAYRQLRANEGDHRGCCAEHGYHEGVTCKTCFDRTFGPTVAAAATAQAEQEGCPF
jgi:hypothetical protein